MQTKRIFFDINIPLPKTSPDISPIPTTVIGLHQRCAPYLENDAVPIPTHHAVIPIFLWS